MANSAREQNAVPRKLAFQDFSKLRGVSVTVSQVQSRCNCVTGSSSQRLICYTFWSLLLGSLSLAAAQAELLPYSVPLASCTT